MPVSAHLFRYPALSLAVLGLLSGGLGTAFLGSSYGKAPHPGIYMVLTGVWFGLVIGFAVWRWGKRSGSAVAMAVAATWIGWEAAVNLALQLDGPWLEASRIAGTVSKAYIAGFAAGAVGALATWAGVAAFTSMLRRVSAAALIVATGAVFGLLLPWTNNYDSGAILLLPWQAAVAAAIGYYMTPAHAPAQHDPGALAIEG